MEAEEAGMVLHAALRLRRERVTGESVTAKERERQRITAAITLIDNGTRFSHMPQHDADYIRGLLADNTSKRMLAALKAWE